MKGKPSKAAAKISGVQKSNYKYNIFQQVKVKNNVFSDAVPRKSIGDLLIYDKLGNVLMPKLVELSGPRLRPSFDAIGKLVYIEKVLRDSYIEEVTKHLYAHSLECVYNNVTLKFLAYSLLKESHKTLVLHTKFNTLTRPKFSIYKDKFENYLMPDNLRIFQAILEHFNPYAREHIIRLEEKNYDPEDPYAIDLKRLMNYDRIGQYEKLGRIPFWDNFSHQETNIIEELSDCIREKRASIEDIEDELFEEELFPDEKFMKFYFRGFFKLMKRVELERKALERRLKYREVSHLLSPTPTEVLRQEAVALFSINIRKFEHFTTLDNLVQQYRAHKDALEDELNRGIEEKEYTNIIYKWTKSTLDDPNIFNFQTKKLFWNKIKPIKIKSFTKFLHQKKVYLLDLKPKKVRKELKNKYKKICAYKNIYGIQLKPNDFVFFFGGSSFSKIIRRKKEEQNIIYITLQQRNHLILIPREFEDFKTLRNYIKTVKLLLKKQKRFAFTIFFTEEVQMETFLGQFNNTPLLDVAEQIVDEEEFERDLESTEIREKEKARLEQEELENPDTTVLPFMLERPDIEINIIGSEDFVQKMPYEDDPNFHITIHIEKLKKELKLKPLLYHYFFHVLKQTKFPLSLYYIRKCFNSLYTLLDLKKASTAFDKFNINPDLETSTKFIKESFKTLRVVQEQLNANIFLFTYNKYLEFDPRTDTYKKWNKRTLHLPIRKDGSSSIFIPFRQQKIPTPMEYLEHLKKKGLTSDETYLDKPPLNIHIGLPAKLDAYLAKHNQPKIIIHKPFVHAYVPRLFRYHDLISDRALVLGDKLYYDSKYFPLRTIVRCLKKQKKTKRNNLAFFNHKFALENLRKNIKLKYYNDKKSKKYFQVHNMFLNDKKCILLTSSMSKIKTFQSTALIKNLDNELRSFGKNVYIKETLLNKSEFDSEIIIKEYKDLSLKSKFHTKYAFRKILKFEIEQLKKEITDNIYYNNKNAKIFAIVNTNKDKTFKNLLFQRRLNITNLFRTVGKHTLFARVIYTTIHLKNKAKRTNTEITHYWKKFCVGNISRESARLTKETNLLRVLPSKKYLYPNNTFFDYFFQKKFILTNDCIKNIVYQGTYIESPTIRNNTKTIRLPVALKIFIIYLVHFLITDAKKEHYIIEIQAPREKKIIQSLKKIEYKDVIEPKQSSNHDNIKDNKILLEKERDFIFKKTYTNSNSLNNKLFIKDKEKINFQLGHYSFFIKNLKIQPQFKNTTMLINEKKNRYISNHKAIANYVIVKKGYRKIRYKKTSLSRVILKRDKFSENNFFYFDSFDNKMIEEKEKILKGYGGRWERIGPRQYKYYLKFKKRTSKKIIRKRTNKSRLNKIHKKISKVFSRTTEEGINLNKLEPKEKYRKCNEKIYKEEQRRIGIVRSHLKEIKKENTIILNLIGDSLFNSKKASIARYLGFLFDLGFGYYDLKNTRDIRIKALELRLSQLTLNEQESEPLQNLNKNIETNFNKILNTTKATPYTVNDENNPTIKEGLYDYNDRINKYTEYEKVQAMQSITTATKDQISTDFYNIISILINIEKKRHQNIIERKIDVKSIKKFKKEKLQYYNNLTFIRRKQINSTSIETELDLQHSPNALTKYCNQISTEYNLRIKIYTTLDTKKNRIFHYIKYIMSINEYKQFQETTYEINIDKKTTSFISLLPHTASKSLLSKNIGLEKEIKKSENTNRIKNKKSLKKKEYKQIKIPITFHDMYFTLLDKITTTFLV